MIPRELGQLEIIAKVSRKYISKKTSLISQKFGRENIFQRRGSDLKDAIKPHSYRSLYPPQQSCRGVYNNLLKAPHWSKISCKQCDTCTNEKINM
jgi:hypothetical protein